MFFKQKMFGAQLISAASPRHATAAEARHSRAPTSPGPVAAPSPAQRNERGRARVELRCPCNAPRGSVPNRVRASTAPMHLRTRTDATRSRAAAARATTRQHCLCTAQPHITRVSERPIHRMPESVAHRRSCICVGCTASAPAPRAGAGAAEAFGDGDGQTL